MSGLGFELEPHVFLSQIQKFRANKLSLTAFETIISSRLTKISGVTSIKRLQTANYTFSATKNL